eukprot:868430-Pleurochrysis_carterae.AAC.8
MGLLVVPVTVFVTWCLFGIQASALRVAVHARHSRCKRLHAPGNARLVRTTALRPFARLSCRTRHIARGILPARKTSSGACSVFQVDLNGMADCDIACRIELRSGTCFQDGSHARRKSTDAFCPVPEQEIGLFIEHCALDDGRIFMDMLTDQVGMRLNTRLSVSPLVVHDQIILGRPGSSM